MHTEGVLTHGICFIWLFIVMILTVRLFPAIISLTRRSDIRAKNNLIVIMIKEGTDKYHKTGLFETWNDNSVPSQASLWVQTLRNDNVIMK